MAYFPNDYFHGETRDGFYIEPMMKCAWAAEIEVLEVVSEICEKHNIHYFADFGTLLGAVRHKGFIPWDDDMDITMLREDFERFLKIAPAELPKGWHVHSIRDNPFHNQLHAIVKNTDKIDYSPDHLRRFHGCPYSVGLDLYPLDVLAPTAEEDQAVCDLLKILIHTVHLYEEYPAQALELLPEIEELCNIKFDNNKNPKNQLMLLADQYCQLYNHTGNDMISYYASHADPDYLLSLSSSWYRERIILPFETTVIMAPAGYDQILRANYGDYMTPVRGAQSHEYPFWKKQEQILAEVWNNIQQGGIL